MTYFYDGSREGFFTAFLLAYHDKDAILTSGSSQLSLGQQSFFIKADAEKAEKCKQRFLSFDKKCVHDLDMMLRSGERARDNVAFRYFRLLSVMKMPIRGMHGEPIVTAANECIHRVSYEVHRFHGFLRFMESASGALYAPISPDHDICDLLLPHFRARLPKYPFVIHDVGRKKAVVYDGKESFVAPLERADVLLSADEEAWRDLWKRYYASVNIPSRERLKQMRGYLPVRYWKFLPELNGGIPAAPLPTWKDEPPRP